MITARFTDRDGQLRAVTDGHAGMNPGNDPVCAAVSCLMYTLMGGVDNLTQGKRMVRADIADGHFDIRYRPQCDSDKKAATLLWNYTIIGMLQLQQKYPECVKII